MGWAAPASPDGSRVRRVAAARGMRSSTHTASTRRRPALHRARAGLIAALALASLGCSGFTDVVRSRFGGKVRVEVYNAPDLNRDFPLAVDFLVAYDKGLYEELKELDAQTWFANRDQYLKDFEAELDSHYWEWVPGRRVAPQKLRYKLGARGGVVFAHYFTPGAHRVAIEPLKGFILRLGESGFTVEPRHGRKKAAKKRKKAGKLKLPEGLEG